MSRKAPERPLAIPIMSKFKQMEQKSLLKPAGRRQGLGLNRFSDWDIGKDYECIKMLGQGSYGAVA